MDIATVIGLISSFGLLFWAFALNGGAGLFVDLTGLLVVLGGTMTTMLTRYTVSQIVDVMNVIMKTILQRRMLPEEVIAQLTDMANIARRDGILALERVKSKDRFLQTAINQCVDGADPEFLENVMRKDLEYLTLRHQEGIELLEGIAETAPAYGMIGSLVGLVQMMANMNDPNALGTGMSAAILATFYGAVVANVVFLPLAAKLGHYSREEQLTRNIIIDGMIGIQKGINPRMLQESLKIALPPKVRDAME